MEISFISRNAFKIEETERLLKGSGIKIVPFKHQLNELQTHDTKLLVYDKAIKAFSQIGRPLIVEHTSLMIDKMKGLPGGLTQVFWDKLEADAFCDLCGRSKIVAKSIIAYCNTKTVQYFEGEISGIVADIPRGNRDFQWDCVFIPDGYTKTFAEMGLEKDLISMRRIAFDRLLKRLQHE